jgi:hypothetical protein
LFVNVLNVAIITCHLILYHHAHSSACSLLLPLDAHAWRQASFPIASQLPIENIENNCSRQNSPSTPCSSFSACVPSCGQPLACLQRCSDCAAEHTALLLMDERRKKEQHTVSVIDRVQLEPGEFWCVWVSLSCMCWRLRVTWHVQRVTCNV